MLMVESRVAVDFERTADFAGKSTIVKLSDFQGGNGHLPAFSLWLYLRLCDRNCGYNK